VQFGERFAAPCPYAAFRSGVAHRDDAPRSSTPRDVLRVNRVLHPLAPIEQRDEWRLVGGTERGDTNAATVARVTVHPRCYYYAQLRAGSASGCRTGGKEAGQVESNNRERTQASECRSGGGSGGGERRYTAGRQRRRGRGRGRGRRRGQRWESVAVVVVVEVSTTDGGGSGGSGGQSPSRRGCRRKEAATRPQKRRGVRGRACRHVQTARRLYSDGTTKR